jgi:hypothetical protein
MGLESDCCATPAAFRSDYRFGPSESARSVSALYFQGPCLPIRISFCRALVVSLQRQSGIARNAAQKRDLHRASLDDPIEDFNLDREGDVVEKDRHVYASRVADRHISVTLTRNSVGSVVASRWYVPKVYPSHAARIVILQDGTAEDRQVG